MARTVVSPGLRSEDLREVLEETETIDDAIWFPVFIHNRCDAACAAGESPCHAQLRLRADAIEPLHDGLKARRSVCEEDGRLETELLQHPGRLGIECAGTGSDRVHPIAFTQ